MGLRVRWKTLGGNLNTVDQKPDLYLAERVIIIYISLTCHGPFHNRLIFMLRKRTGSRIMAKVETEDFAYWTCKVHSRHRATHCHEMMSRYSCETYFNVGRLELHYAE